ncbi:hypothetical protein LCGC14_0867130 [marine sediment metagenome]|uniref:Uncharacterized protein n=1 Tax=marine sediment metagenome TaxID=412755 RepID=A0A0F9SCS1_9ZZZZ
MIEVNDVIEQAGDKNMYVVTEIIGDKLFCLQVEEEGKTMDKMAVLDVRTATEVTAPVILEVDPLEEDDERPIDEVPDEEDEA